MRLEEDMSRMKSLSLLRNLSAQLLLFSVSDSGRPLPLAAQSDIKEIHSAESGAPSNLTRPSAGTVVFPCLVSLCVRV